MLLSEHRQSVGARHAWRSCNTDALAPLCDARWLACLGVLLMNDRLLKRLAATHAWLPLFTGKLSDLAGIVVGPVLAWSLVGLALPGRRYGLRWAAFALVAAGFSAINLSVACAQSFEAVGRALGLDWRVWVDPTDLLVLPLLWLAMNVCRAPRPIASPAIGRAGAIVAAAACLATSDPWSDAPYPPAVRNAAGEKITITVQEYLGAVECDDVLPGRVEVDASLFRAARSVVLVDGDQEPLVTDGELDPIEREECDLHPAFRDADDAGTRPTNASDASTTGAGADDAGSQPTGASARIEKLRHRCGCGAAIIAGEHLEPILVSWDLRKADLPDWRAHDYDQGLPDGVVHLERFGDELRPTWGDAITVEPHDVGGDE
jgi:hypothetical protein